MNWRFWKVRVDKESIPYTAFVCHKGRYEYNRMLFCLMNAPTTSQRAPDIILSGCKWQTCLVYLDEIIVFSQTKEENLVPLDQVLQVLRMASISMDLKKVSFFPNLGHIIRPGTPKV